MQRSISNTDLRRKAEGRPLGRSLLISGALAIVLIAVASTPFWERFELGAFDLLTVTTAPGAKGLPIVIVGIDEPSFGEFGMQWPWPRKLHARLVETLSRQGAAVTAFDIVFAEPTDKSDDERLAAAIEKAGNVVLAGDLAVQETTRFSQVMEIEPLPLFREAGARTGIATVSQDSDLKVRSVPEHSAAFWREVIRLYRERIPDGGREISLPEKSRIRYVGPDHSFEYVSYYQALDPKTFLPPDTFKNKIVLVGFDVKTSPEPGASQADMFATPFLMSTGWPSPGVEIQANLVSAGLTGRVVREVPRPVVTGLLIGVLFLSALAMRDWRPLPSLAWGTGIMAVLAVATWALFAQRDTWLPVLSSVTAVGMTYVAEGGAAFLTERRQRQQIKQIFAYYVSPHVVEEMTAHPERLVLGGTRRELTIMFTDLANFTSLSEQMGAEETAQVLNFHLTAVTRIIMRYNGTVGKFIGDAVMAFWGAPLDDPEHALHACQAAQDMQAEMERQREELRTAGLPALFMRIGVHTGEAIVGNMGSEERFDYTAIGDSVNLASRLEGVNKLYGTGILLSAATAERLGGRLALRRVDRVRVKGKKQAIEIYAFCPDAGFAKINDEAVAAYQERRWDDAVALWQQVLERAPGDTIAGLYLRRIDQFRKEPPPPEWDGGTVLEKF